MEKLPADICMEILCLLDHRNLSNGAPRKWKILASENLLWSNLFKERWGTDRAIFYAPIDSKLWKDGYEVQDRCDRVGLYVKTRLDNAYTLWTFFKNNKGTEDNKRRRRLFTLYTKGKFNDTWVQTDSRPEERKVAHQVLKLATQDQARWVEMNLD